MSKQKEHQIIKEKQIEREIEYFIYQDLENVLCMLGELEQTITTFQGQADQSYLPIATNKMILQANLSYGIHFDQYCQHKNTHEQFLEECNRKAIEIFKEVQEKAIICTDEKIKKICDFYLEKDFQKNKQFLQLPLEPVSREAQFNQKALEKVIWGTQAVDMQLNQVQQDQYQPPTVEQILEKINQRKKYCEEQLIKNFGIKKVVQINENNDEVVQKNVEGKVGIEIEEKENIQDVENQKEINQPQDGMVIEENDKVKKPQDVRQEQFNNNIDANKGLQQKNLNSVLDRTIKGDNNSDIDLIQIE